MNKNLSRRDFLKLAGVTSAGLALSACGVKATEFPTATFVPPTETTIPPTETTIPPTETIIPTITPAPTSTPILPLEQLPQTKQALTKFVQAFQEAGVNITSDNLLQNGLEIRKMIGTNKKQYDVAFVHVENLSQAGVEIGGDYPLMIKTDDKWERELLGKNLQDINFGYTRRIDPKTPMIDGKDNAAFFSPSAIYPSNQYSPLRNLEGEYIKDNAVQKSFFVDGEIDTERLNDYINNATTTFKGIKFTGYAIRQVPNNPKSHAIVITNQHQIQKRLDDIDDPVIAEQALIWFIKNTTLLAIDMGIKYMLLNEFLRDSNRYWSHKINKTSEETIELAVRAVKIASKDSKTTIVFNENGFESENSNKRTEFISILNNLREKGLFPKSGDIVIGIQYHNGIGYNPQNLKTTIEYFYKNGINEIRLTEVDIMQKNSPTHSQIIEYYLSMLKTVKDIKSTYQDLNISIIFFDEYWETDRAKNARITDVPIGLYQLIAELYK